MVFINSCFKMKWFIILHTTSPTLSLLSFFFFSFFFGLFSLIAISSSSNAAVQIPLANLNKTNTCSCYCNCAIDHGKWFCNLRFSFVFILLLSLFVCPYICTVTLIKRKFSFFWYLCLFDSFLSFSNVLHEYEKDLKGSCFHFDLCRQINIFESLWSIIFIPIGIKNNSFLILQKKKIIIFVAEY